MCVTGFIYIYTHQFLSITINHYSRQMMINVDPNHKSLSMMIRTERSGLGHYSRRILAAEAEVIGLHGDKYHATNR